MYKKLLLASVAGTAIVAGTLNIGIHSARAADDGLRFMFRYSPGVLLVATADDGSESGDEDEETGDTDPDPDDDGEDGDPDDDGEEELGEGTPVNGIVFTPRVELQDSNGNGYGDAGERIYVRATIRNVIGSPISDISLGYRIALGSMTRAGDTSTALEPGESFEAALGPVYLDAEMLADLASGLQFEAFVSLTAVDGETWPFEMHAKAAPTVPFGVYEPTKPEEITLSNVSAAHVDIDGDGYGDRREIIRVSFSARNTGGLPAQGVSFEITFPEWPAATAYCDRASLPANGSMACTTDIELTRDDLDAFGPPETVVTLNGVISMVSLNGSHYAAGEHSTVLTPISFRVPPVVYAPHLRVVASDGWVFECATPWDAAFVSEHRNMLLTRWDTSSRTVVEAGGKTAPGKTFGLKASWFQVYPVDLTTMTAGAAKISSMRPGDTRPSIPSSTPQPCGPMGKFEIVSHGDLTTAYDIVFESVEVIDLPM